MRGIGYVNFRVDNLCHAMQKLFGSFKGDAFSESVAHFFIERGFHLGGDGFELLLVDAVAADLDVQKVGGKRPCPVHGHRPVLQGIRK